MFDGFAQKHILRNGMRLLLNLVPDYISQHKLKDVNWLQPLEVLGGRSVVQLMIGNKELRSRLEVDCL